MRVFRISLLLAAGLAPFSLSGANYVFVFNSSSTTASVYDADTMVQLNSSIAVGLGATPAFGVPDTANQGKFLKFSVVTTTSVVVLNPDFSVKTALGLGGTLSSAPNAAVLSGDAKWLLVTAGTRVNILNTSNDAFVFPAIVPTLMPLGVTVTPDSKTAYILESNSSRIDAINLTVSPPSLSGSVTLPSGVPTALGMAPNGSRLYAATNGQLIYDIDRNNNLPDTAISNTCLGNPADVSFDPDPTSYAVINCGSTASILNLPTRTLLPNAFVTTGLAGFFSKIVLPGSNKAFLLAGSHVYYGQETAGSVPSEVLNPQTATPYGTIAADIGVSPDGSALFALFADLTPKLVKISTTPNFQAFANVGAPATPTGLSVVYAPALTATVLEIYGGNNQTGLNDGLLFPSSLSVRARNGTTPAYGVTVAFTSNTAGVGFTSSPAITNLSGVAETLFNVPVTTAIQVTATVTAGGTATPRVFTINPGSNPGNQPLTKISGDNQLVVQNTSFPFNLVVKGTPNATLNITTGTTPISCDPTVTTDPTTGMATFSCLAGALPAPGTSAVGYTITVADLAQHSVQFTATVVPDATFLPANVNLSLSPSVGQAGQTGTLAVQALTVNNGTPASVGVMFASSQKDMVFNPASTVLAGGFATSTVTFGCSLGTGTITATLQSAGASVAAFGFVTVAGPLAQLVKAQGDGQSGNAGQTLSTGLVVTAADSCGNPIANQAVTWTVSPSNAATLRTLIGNTDNSGHSAVLVTLGNVSGPFTVTATSGTFSATFNLSTNVVPTKLVVASGSGQTVALGQAAAQPLVVQVTDDNGAAVAGVSVTFAVASGFATLSTTQASTDAQGHASTSVTAGASLGLITVNATAIGKTVAFTLTTIGRVPMVTLLGFVNGASFRQGWVPGSTGTIFGVGLGEGVNGIVQASQAPFPFSLQGVSVTVGGIPAPMISIANVQGQEQINIQVPFGLTAPGSTTVVISNNGSSATFTGVPLLALMPGIFENIVNGAKIAAALHADYSGVTPSNPARRGEIIQLFLTGLGQTNPPVSTNVAGPIPPSPTLVQPVVGINGQGAQVIGSWYAPTLYTAYQINFVVPQNVTPGLATLSIVVNGVASQDSRLPIQ